MTGMPFRNPDAEALQVPMYRAAILEPLILPGRALPGNGEVRDIVPHLDEAQLD